MKKEGEREIRYPDCRHNYMVRCISNSRHASEQELAKGHP